MLKKTIAFGIVCLFSVGLIITGCNQQDNRASTMQVYPTKPITFIVPYAAGGTTDMIARTMQKEAVKYLGRPLVITNKPGAGAIIGWNELCGAKPDGHAIGIVATGSILQPLYGPTRYQYHSALEPLVQVTSTPIVAAVLVEKPWASIDDLIEYAKEHPGEIKYGHTGLGTAQHVVGEMFARKADVNILQVPFNGESEALAALLRGHVSILFTTYPSIKAKSDKIRILAIAESKRLNNKDFLNVPTFREQGIDVVFNIWLGVGAPKMIPEEVKNKLAGELGLIINDPEFIKNLEALGMTVDYLGPEEFKNKWDNETVRLAKIIKEAGIVEKIAAQKN